MAPKDFFSSTDTELCLSPMKFDTFPQMSLTTGTIHYTHKSLQFLSDFLTIIFVSYLKMLKQWLMQSLSYITHVT